jgi:delta-1-pyrroline-5-carboxylate synthetase
MCILDRFIEPRGVAVYRSKHEKDKDTVPSASAAESASKDGNTDTGSGDSTDYKSIATAARSAARGLQSLSGADRSAILSRMAELLKQRENEVLAANQADLEAAAKIRLGFSSFIIILYPYLKPFSIPAQSLNRLKLTAQKIDVLCAGILDISAQDDPINRRRTSTEISPGLILDNVTCSIGVLLIIFESRPDCLPQIAALAIKSGNALIAKGGKEAEQTLSVLLGIIHQAISDHSTSVPGHSEMRLTVCNAVNLVHSREDISQLLKLDEDIDLVIPRGSNSLVKYIKMNTRIPVMGHSDGVCHIYVDIEADIAKTTRIIIDSKTDYPSACNAVETVLLHSSFADSPACDALLKELRKSGVVLLG